MKRNFFFLLAVIAVLILEVSLREEYYPYKAKPVNIRHNLVNLYGLKVDDLDEDGIDEVIRVYNQDYSNRFFPRIHEKLVNRGIKSIVIGNFGGKHWVGGLQINSQKDMILNEITDINEDGVKEIFLRRRDNKGNEMAYYDYHKDTMVVFMSIAHPDCGERAVQFSVNIYGKFYDPGNRENMVVCKAQSGYCPVHREIITVSPQNPEKYIYRYRYGAYVNRVSIKNLDGDLYPEIYLDCAVVNNGGNRNGTSDSLAYVIALDHRMNELWKRSFSRPGAEVRTEIVRNKNNEVFHIIACVCARYENGITDILLLNPENGATEDSLRIEGRIASILQDQGAVNRVFLGTSLGEIVELAVEGNTLNRESGEKVSDLLVRTVSEGNILGDRNKEFAVLENETGDLFLVNQEKDQLLRIKSKAGEIRYFNPIICSDGKRRVIYTAGPDMYVSDVVKTSRMDYIFSNFRFSIAFLVLYIIYSTLSLLRKPDKLKGQILLLEQLKTSANHGELSIISSLNRVVRLLEMIKQTGGTNQQLVRQLATSIKIYHDKWSEDLRAAIDILNNYRLYSEYRKQLMSSAQSINVLTSGNIETVISGKNGIDSENADSLAGKMRHHTDIISDILISMINDLDEKISSDPVEIMKSVLDSYMMHFKEKEIECIMNVGENKKYSFEIGDLERETGIESPEQGEEDNTSIAVRIPQRTLYMIFDNIISNSIRALEDADIKRIIIDIEKLEHMVRIIIRDTGCGIEPEQQDSIFDLGVTSKKHGGTGLYYTRKVLATYAATIDFKSEGYMKGAEVEMVIPRGRNAK